MWKTYLRRGALAGVLAGSLAAFVGLLGGTQTIDQAELLAHASDHDRDHADHADHADGHEHTHDEHAHGDEHDDHAHDHAGEADSGGHLLSRGEQKAGFAVGALLLGAGGGLAFGGVFGWLSRGARGRGVGGKDPTDGLAASPSAGVWQRDDGWERSLALGASVIGAVVVLPVLAYPPIPPGAGDPATVNLRTGLYLAVVGVGVLLAIGARAASRRLAARGLAGPERRVLVAAAIVVAAALVVIALPAPEAVGGAAGELPAELVWRFRLESVGTQLTLWGSIAVAFGLLTRREALAWHPDAVASAR